MFTSTANKLTTRPSWLPSFRTVLLLSALLRWALILYSEWHDAHSTVKYTDVDYQVFTDAAWYVLHPRADGGSSNGPLGPALQVGSPYARETYRYTPLLAILLVPNHWLHPSFGKYLFASCDVLNGLLVYKLLLSTILPVVRRLRNNTTSNSKSKDTLDEVSCEPLATICSAIHLLNPLVFSISTRGSAESILSTLVLLTLHFVIAEQWDAAAIMLGLSVHWKIYPFIYGVACLRLLSRQDSIAPSWRREFQSMFNSQAVRFFLLSFGTFAFLGGVCYSIWGYTFLHETYLYHLHRLDHRHNFSPYFYLTYLTYPSPNHHPLASAAGWSLVLRSSLISFAPQMALTLGLGLVFGQRKDDVVLTWFVQTGAFVLFNKVCTSQYFLWYIVFLPLLLPNLSMSSRRAFACLAIWIGSQALWLSEAYRLEFLGDDVYYGVWARGLVYVASNVWVLVQVIEGYNIQ